MRIFVVLRHLLPLLAIAAPALAHAQFQEPSPEELKMTSDPKAPGAAAVYLNVEEITDDPLHFRSYYARIKVLEEKGKELATVEIPYEHGNYKVTDIKARTIHADGAVIPLQGKPEDLLVSKTKENSEELQINKKVFNLPSVEVGSILEFRYQIRYDDDYFSSPFWRIQRPYFVHKAHYVFTPFKAFLSGAQNQTSMYLVDTKGEVARTLMWWHILPAGVDVKTDAIGRYSLDLADIPPTPSEEWMPPIDSTLYKVFFYYKSVGSAQEFWSREAKRWSKEVDHFADTSNSIRQAVAELIAPADTDLVKAQKLYKAVQALDNTNFSRVKGDAELKQLGLRVAKRAEDTWAQKSGSSQDITLLYLAMLRAAGLTACAVKVVDRQRATFADSFLNFDQLDDDLILLTSEGKDILLDPGEKMAPFQTLHWRHSFAGGVRQGAGDHSLVTTPAQDYRTNSLLRLGDLTLEEHGAITGDLRFIMTGQEALRWRQVALTNDEDEVKKRFDRWLKPMVPDGVQARIDHFLALDDPDAKLMAIVKVDGSLGAPTAKRLLLPGFFFQSHGRQPFVSEEKRLIPVDMRYGELVQDHVVYHLPPGLAVEGAPQNNKISWPAHASFAIGVASQLGAVTVERSFARGFTLVKPEEYQDLRAFYQKVAASDQQQLVLTASPVAKAN